MKIVIKIGGSMLYDETGFRKDYLFSVIKVLEKVKKDNQLIVSVGGGKPVRNVLKQADEFSLSNEEKEWIVIDILHSYARFIAYILKTEPILNLESVSESSEGVVSGIVPGRSTDANAVICAEKINADLFIKLTDVSGIYDKDPDKFEDAEKLDRMTFEDLDKIKVQSSPGSYGILDPMALDSLKKTRIKTIVMSGENPEDILKAIKGEKIGTIIE